MLRALRCFSMTAAAVTLLASGVSAVDTTFLSGEAPDLAEARAKIKSKDFKGAIAVLDPLLDKYEHADLFNLVGFSYRKMGNYKNAAFFYAKALEFDPSHLGAPEYQGEMFVETGQIHKARENLARLVALCPSGCEEREDLEEAIATAAGPGANPN